uniref:hypothetical protein n=1 Tax=Staphylococcus aureus TaxID=1280 RepID=UPI0038B3BEC4
MPADGIFTSRVLLAPISGRGKGGFNCVFWTPLSRPERGHQSISTVTGQRLSLTYALQRDIFTRCVKIFVYAADFKEEASGTP